MVHAQLCDLYIAQYVHMVGGVAECGTVADEQFQGVVPGMLGKGSHLPVEMGSDPFACLE